MLRIITGPAGCGKSESIFRAMGSLAGQGRSALLIVPESYSHQAERRLLALCGNHAGRLVSVTTFSKLTRDILASAGVRGRWLDAGGRVLYMHQALVAAHSSLEYFRSAPRPRMVARLLETVDELTASGVLPAQLMQAAAQGELPPKIRDLGLIYAAFEAQVTQGGLDWRDPFDVAAGLIPQISWLKEAEVFIDGFSGFTAQRRHALGQMLSSCRGMCVSLLLDDDPVLFSQQEKTLAQLTRLADSCGTRCVVEKQERPGSAPLAGLAREVFDFAPRRNGDLPQGAVEIFGCADPAEECSLAAALCRSQILPGRLRAREIALVCGDMEQYAPMIENAFAQYQVPVFASVAEDVTGKPPVLAALGAAMAVDDGLSAESVLAWLKSGLCGMDTGRRDKLENYALIWGIRGNKWLRPFTYSTTGYDNPVPDEEQRLAEVESIRQEIAPELERLGSQLKKCTRGDQFAQALTEHMERMSLEERIDQAVSRLEAEGQQRMALQYAQLYEIILDALGQFLGAAGRQDMQLKDFLLLLRLAISQYQVDTIPATLDAVQACTFERLPMSGIKHVIIIGAREGLLPKNRGGNSLLSESERIALEGAGVVLTQSAEDMAFEEQSYIYRALALPQRLTLIWPRAGADGDEARPSHILGRVKKICNVAEQSGAQALYTLQLTARGPAFGAACRALASPGDPVCDAAMAHFGADAQDTKFFDRLGKWAQNPRAPIKDGRLIEGIYGKVLPMTASRVETVASCRFSYFMSYGLKARPRREARLGAPEIGTFVHEVVEKSVRDLCRGQGCRMDEVVMGHCREYFDRLFKNKELTARLKGVFDTLFENVMLIVKNVWDEICAGDFKPMFFELDFSRQGDIPPLEMDVGPVTAQIRGKIDRVDGWIDGDTLYLKVVDYKTGRKVFRLSDVYYGLNLQMFIYLGVLGRVGQGGLARRAAEVFGQSPMQIGAGGALYIPARAPWAQAENGSSPEEITKAIDKNLKRVGIVSSSSRVLQALEHNENGGFRFLPVSIKRDGSLGAGSSVADAEQMGSLIRRTQAQVGQLARAIAAGDISANPYRTGRDFSACGWCDFRAACHFDETLKTDRHRYIPPMKDSEVFEKLAAEEVEANGG